MSNPNLPGVSAQELLAQYADPNRPPACEECGRRPVPSRLAPGQWIDSHGGSCSLNSALRECERCGQRHVDLTFDRALACIMDVPLAEGRELQQRILDRLDPPESDEKETANASQEV